MKWVWEIQKAYLYIILVLFYNNLKSQRLPFKEVTINALAHVVKWYLIVLQILNTLLMKFLSIVTAACQIQAYLNVISYNLKFK